MYEKETKFYLRERKVTVILIITCDTHKDIGRKKGGGEGGRGGKGGGGNDDEEIPWSGIAREASEMYYSLGFRRLETLRTQRKFVQENARVINRRRRVL